MESERYDIARAAAAAINARASSRAAASSRSGTTTTRTLESRGTRERRPHRRRSRRSTDLFIYPGFEFRVVGGLLTNFHLPQSSLLMLVSALRRPRARAGRLSTRPSPSAIGSTATATRC